jgi:hypothetical protein
MNNHLYSHIEGMGNLDYDTDVWQLEVTKGDQVKTVPIGPNGLIELGFKLISLGHEINQNGVDADVGDAITDLTLEAEQCIWSQELAHWLETDPYCPYRGGRLDELYNLISFITDQRKQYTAMYRDGGVLPAGAARSAR